MYADTILDKKGIRLIEYFPFNITTHGRKQFPACLQ